jgi:hypothetical protein
VELLLPEENMDLFAVIEVMESKLEVMSKGVAGSECAETEDWRLR